MRGLDALTTVRVRRHIVGLSPAGWSVLSTVVAVALLGGITYWGLKG